MNKKFVFFTVFENETKKKYKYIAVLIWQVCNNSWIVEAFNRGQLKVWMYTVRSYVKTTNKSTNSNNNK